jgi:LPS sulfotransferase NodH
MSTLSQRFDRGLKTTALRSLRLNLRVKRLFTRRRNSLFVTCFPKSGSTFLVSSLATTTGYMRQFLGYDHLNEQDLYLPNLIDTYNMNIVCHQHTRATAPNLELILEFGIQPVVLVRNVFDCLVSLRDHLERESRRTPVFNATDEFHAKPHSEQFDELIDLALPWYVNFVMSWKSAEAEGTPTLWVAYEDMMADKAGTVRRILEFYGLTRFNSEVDAAISHVDNVSHTRFNKGVSGRGEDQLSTSQRQRIVDRFRHYPDMDFSMIGIVPVHQSIASQS